MWITFFRTKQCQLLSPFLQMENWWQRFPEIERFVCCEFTDAHTLWLFSPLINKKVRQSYIHVMSTANYIFPLLNTALERKCIVLISFCFSLSVHYWRIVLWSLMAIWGSDVVRWLRMVKILKLLQYNLIFILGRILFPQI